MQNDATRSNIMPMRGRAIIAKLVQVAWAIRKTQQLNRASSMGNFAKVAPAISRNRLHRQFQSKLHEQFQRCL